MQAGESVRARARTDMLGVARAPAVRLGAPRARAGTVVCERARARAHVLQRVVLCVSGYGRVLLGDVGRETVSVAMCHMDGLESKNTFPI